MLLTADHLAALEELGETALATPPQSAPQERTCAIYRALARDGLAQHAHGQGYVLTTAGRQAQRLVAGMLATGYLYQRELMTSNWHFIDDTIGAAIEAASQGDDRVDVAAAPLLLGRGLAELREDPHELRLHLALTVFGNAWLELMDHLHAQPGGAHASDIAMDSAPSTVDTEVQLDATLA